MRVKNLKLMLSTMIVFCGLGLAGIDADAAPKKMADGTIFDAEYYANTYPDVRAALGTNETVLYQHYKNYGRAEGRKPCADNATVASGLIDNFDAEYYAATYPDVRAAFGNDAAALYNHYITYGKAEGRKPCAEGVPAVEKVATPVDGATLVSSYQTWSMAGDYIVDTYSNGIKVLRSIEGSECVDSKYWIPRTDYSDGLQDADGNGIDDRDPLNSCGYMDLNYNGIIDGAPSRPYSAPESEIVKYRMCEHGVLDGTSICDAKECREWRERMSHVVVL